MARLARHSADDTLYSVNNSTAEPEVFVAVNKTEAPLVEAEAVADWPPLVTYGVPALCILLFAILLILLYLFPSPKKETRNCIQRCLNKEESKNSGVEMRASQRAVIQARPRTHKESINEGFDSVSVSGV